MNLEIIFQIKESLKKLNRLISNLRDDQIEITTDLTLLIHDFRLLFCAMHDPSDGHIILIKSFCFSLRLSIFFLTCLECGN